ncbi:PoNe immunity protein domain-containing protein [Janthinobacterium sp. HH107]|uniref:PoNe immunity protein domain-containing protein n=1 Tax=Janthinobacterium sp. HH107 TaxID=1537279 RepID=UPI0008758BDB|nr:PoNe immunity protein domain-containing protein [Janthinobacterium sp. HH107]
MMLLNTLFEELTGRGSGTEAERHERYNWLQQLRFNNPQADEGGPMAGIPSYHWFRLPQALVVAGQHTDLLVGTINAQYLVFEGRHAAAFAAELGLQYDANNRIDRPGGLDELLDAYEEQADGSWATLPNEAPAPPLTGWDDVYFRVRDLSDSKAIQSVTTIAYESSRFPGYTLLGTTLVGAGAIAHDDETAAYLQQIFADWAIQRECADACLPAQEPWPHAPRQTPPAPFGTPFDFARNLAYLDALLAAYERAQAQAEIDGGDSAYWACAAASVAYQVFSLRYTAGLPLPDVETALEAAIAACEAARAALAAAYDDDALPAFDFEQLTDYARTLQLLGAALLFGRHDLAMRLAALQTAFDGEDGVYEALLSTIDAQRPAVDEWYFAEPYSALFECLDADDPAQQLDHLQHYLASWHGALVHEDWFNGHLRAHGLGGYYGLWAFEAAAVTKHLGLERSALAHWVMPPTP